ncbi:MAG: DUF58 domain-containing protein [Asgard group archaeon]|nr:DUF58 domain-containing protein [Asgard group archaeon]
MFSPKIKWYLILFFSLLLIGIGLREWLLIISLIPISVFLISYYLTKTPDEINIKITRDLEQKRYQEGEYIDIKLEVENSGEQDFEIIEIKDMLPPELSLQKSSNYVIGSLHKGERTTIRYQIKCDYRGRWEIGPTYVRVRNFLDSSFTQERFDKTIIKITVIPSFSPLQDMPFRTRYPRISEGPFHSKLKGEGLDFAGVREHRPGDSLGRINWRVTAKYGKLFSNEYELYRSAEILLILDATEHSVSVLDNEIKAVLSLAEYFLKYKCQVGLLIIRDTVDRFRLSSSREQLYRITDALIDVKATTIENLDVLDDRLKTSLEKYFPQNCLKFIISPLYNPEINQLLTKIARQERNCLFICPQIIQYEWEHIKNKDNASNLFIHQDLLLRHKTELLKVRQRGLVIYEWDASIPFSVFVSKLKRVAIQRGRVI